MPERFDGMAQTFQRGRMIWRGDTHKIYVLEDGGAWACYDDTFDPAEGDHGPVNPPETGLQEPRFGFRKVWLEQPGLQDRLGLAVAREEPVRGEVQPWEEKGQRLRIGDIVYRLNADGTIAL